MTTHDRQKIWVNLYKNLHQNCDMYIWINILCNSTFWNTLKTWYHGISFFLFDFKFPQNILKGIHFQKSLSISLCLSVWLKHDGAKWLKDMHVKPEGAKQLSNRTGLAGNPAEWASNNIHVIKEALSVCVYIPLAPKVFFFLPRNFWLDIGLASKDIFWYFYAFLSVLSRPRNTYFLHFC